ncbi:DNA repair endonuclease XPF-like isoform X1 [Dendronephthya gigantea]|uniref:DNA repair endonuclease XPF-like isoform X1 n=1 Tax=Dendronephthya gigantea TaxID=151771 RepID=UPI0010699C52|nr:DNA repair endonuclease XPF-like isoform X1 [Dendronephthya gigantea]
MADTIPLLEYESAMFLDVINEDGLLITAKGITTDNILINFLKIHCDPASLVLVVNTSAQEEDHLIEELVKLNALAPKAVTNEYGVSDREVLYLNGGVLFVTSRILVVDMLTKKLPIHLVTGIVVCKAHKIIDSCQEAFILRLYRENNKTGFIKAFSDAPEAFTAGFSKVERVMKNLFVKKLYLWPRFYAPMSAFLERHTPELVELHLQLTPSMLVIQTSILDLISTCLRDIKRLNSFLDPEELTVENSINKSFDKLLRLQLDPVWHQLNSKTKQLVADLKVLRTLLFYLTQYDCVTFYQFLLSLRASERDAAYHSMWMFMDATEALFVHARERVYEVHETKPKAKRQKTLTAVENKSENDNVSRVEKTRELVLEESPKWKVLKDVLEDIDKENSSDKSGETRHVLIAASDQRTCSQLRELLCEGGKALLTRLYEKNENRKGSEKNSSTSNEKSKKQKDKKAKPGLGRKGKSKSGVSKQKSTRKTNKTIDKFLMTRDEEDEDICQNEEQEAEDSSKGAGKLLLKTDNPDECEITEITFGLVSTPLIVIHPLSGTSDPYSLTRTLHEIEPRYVILYDAQMEFVRQLEVFKASRAGIPLRIYFMVYAGSVEEQRYLTRLRKENEAFEMLIKSKATMIIPEEREGKTEAAVQLDRDPSKPSSVASTRKGGGQEKQVAENRKVGDYILTPHICVERKSVSDLISSLNSGRLYTQCVAMTRFYKRPILLIEFDPAKSFSLQAKSSLSNEISLQNVTTKLALLTIHFPKLRVLWCPSPYATAELFDELKQNQPEPDAAVAMEIGSDPSLAVGGERYNAAPQDFLHKLPGINSKNCKTVMNKVKNIHELSELSEERLQEILGNAVNAKKLWEFFHDNHKLEANKR